MNRVATFQLNSVMTAGMQRTQKSLADAQLQFSTGKVAQSYSGVGSEAIRALSARTMLVREEGYLSAASAVTTTLEFYDAYLSSAETNMVELRERVLSAVGQDNATELGGVVETAFRDFRVLVNARENGRALFGGGQAGENPLIPETLADTIGLDPAAAFRNDGVRNSARLADGVDVEYTTSASEFGGHFVEAFGKLAALMPLDGPITTAQRSALLDVVNSLDEGLADVRSVNAENGRRLAYTETLTVRAEDRSMMLTKVIGDVEDADLGQVAVDLTQHQAMLAGSYSIFSKLSGLSLTNYLR